MSKCKHCKSGLPPLPLLSGLTKTHHWNYPNRCLKQQLCSISHNSVDWLGSSSQSTPHGGDMVTQVAALREERIPQPWLYIWCQIVYHCRGCPVQLYDSSNIPGLNLLDASSSNQKCPQGAKLPRLRNTELGSWLRLEHQRWLLIFQMFRILCWKKKLFMTFIKR